MHRFGHTRSPAASDLPHEDERAARARQRPLDQQEIPIRIGADDADLLDRRLLVAHVAGHPQALVDAAGRRARADRAWLAVMIGAMCLGSAPEVVALDLTGEALALR